MVREVQNHARVIKSIRAGDFDGCGPLELYTFVRSTLPTEGYNRQWRVALVTSTEDSSHDFLETVSQNAGYQVMVFKSFTTAQDWLGRI